MKGPPITNDSIAGLSEKLTSVSETKFLDVIQYLSELQFPPTAPSVLPEIRRLMDKARPRLRELKPPRPLTLTRLFCRPFEDLLHSRGSEITEGIPRSEIEPCWQLLTNRDGAGLKDLAAELAAISPSEPRQLAEFTERFWGHAAGILADCVAANQGPRHLRLIADTLAAAKTIEAFKLAVPAKPIGRLGDIESAQVVEGRRCLVERGLSVEGFLLVVAARLETPAELLDFLNRAEIAVAAPTWRKLGAFSIAIIEDQARNFELNGETARPDDLTRAADRLMAALAATQKVLDPAGRTALERSTQGVSKMVREMLDRKVIDAASAAIEAALSNMTGEPDVEALVAAESHARALRRSRRVARLLGLDARVAAMTDSVHRRCEAHIARVIEKMPAASGGQDAAMAGIYRSIRIVELAVGPQEATQLMTTVRGGLSPATSSSVPDQVQSPQPSRPAPALSPRRVLLVDDESSIRKLTREMLRRMTFTDVVEAESGDQALRLFCAGPAPFDLIICDWSMPGISGMEVCKQIRAAKFDLPFLMLTGRNDSASRMAAEASGVSAYISKPFAYLELKEKLQLLLAGR
jgi:two-component system chemotaxis response regulator CheY